MGSESSGKPYFVPRALARLPQSGCNFISHVHALSPKPLNPERISLLPELQLSSSVNLWQELRFGWQDLGIQFLGSAPFGVEGLGSVLGCHGCCRCRVDLSHVYFRLTSESLLVIL